PVDVGEARRIALERGGEAVSGHHLGAHRGEDAAGLVGLGLLDERAQALLDGEPGFEEEGEAAREERHFAGTEAVAAAEPARRAGGRGFGVDRRELERDQAFASQVGARLARRLGFDYAAAGAAFG